MKKTRLLCAGLLLVCGYGYGANGGGQIDVSLTLLPVCEIKSASDSTQVQCAQGQQMRPRMTETPLQAVSGPRTQVDTPRRLLTLIW